MSKVAGIVILAGAGAAGYYAWRDKQQRDIEAQQIAYQQQVAAQQDQGDWWMNYGEQSSRPSLFAQIATPFIAQGVGALGDAIFNRNSTSTGTRSGGFLDNLFGRNQSDTAPASTPGSTRPPAQGGGGGTAPLRDLIGSVEAPQGYGQVYGGVKLKPPKPLETMTVAEVAQWQRDTVSAGSPSSAAGKYQIIGPTLRGLIEEGAVSPYERFDAATQDRLADTLLERRGLSDYRAGRITETQFAQNLSQEWASLPVAIKDRNGRAASGQSYYAGDGLNKSLTSLSNVLDRIRRL